MEGTEDYDKISCLYNALYGDITFEQLVNMEAMDRHKSLITSYSKDKTTILDAACGNGIHATELALNGYNVTATDISNQMVKLTNELAQKHNVKIKTAAKSWLELSEYFDEKFDIVLCIGNSITHSVDAVERKNNVIALSKLLKKDGTLVIDTRNWDKAVLDFEEYTVVDKVTYQGKGYIPLYHWKIRGIEQESEVELLIQEIEDSHVELYRNTMHFTPFLHDNLIQILKELGLTITKDTYTKDCDWYMIYAKQQ